MKNAARAFEHHSGGPRLRPVPTVPKPESDLPYSSLQPGDMPPMMVQLRFRDGRWLSFCYSDMRQIDCRDSGQLELTIFAARTLTVRIEGRHLRELATLLGMGLIRWVQEVDPRDLERDESKAEVTNIILETVESD